MSHPLKSMKIEREDLEREETSSLVNSRGPEYPYGLRIHLGPKELKKVGIVNDAPKIGDILGLHAMVQVVGIDLDENNMGGKDMRVELQITEMALQDRSNQEARDPAKVLFEKQQESAPAKDGMTLLTKG